MHFDVKADMHIDCFFKVYENPTLFANHFVASRQNLLSPTLIYPL
jgi:hypothetical protein